MIGTTTTVEFAISIDETIVDMLIIFIEQLLVC